MPAWLTTLFDLLGAALIVAAVALVYVPAALAVAGLGCLAVSWKAANRP